MYFEYAIILKNYREDFMTDTDFHGITVDFEEHIVSITVDKKLLDFLGAPGNGSVELSNYILKRYNEIFGEPLEISKMSLAVEILVHAYIDVLTQNAKAVKNMLPREVSKLILSITEKIHERTCVIDCGEKSVDNNRFVFDDLAPRSENSPDRKG